MTPFADRQINQLSGGQQQRVFLARALAQGGRLLLLDEPLNGVDASTQETIGELLRRVRDEGGTVLMATHDLELAASWCDDLIMVNHAVIAYGPPQWRCGPKCCGARMADRCWSCHLWTMERAITQVPSCPTRMATRAGSRSPARTRRC